MNELIKIIEKYKGKKVALYGLGTETEKELKELDAHFDIVGLLDGFKNEGKLYGKDIISLADAVQKRVSMIIVVARPGSCKAIAKKIGEICREKDILLFDIRGKDLLHDERNIYTQAKLNKFIDDLSVSISASDKVKIELFKQRIEKIQEQSAANDKVLVPNAYDVGYLFCAPMIVDFILWFHENVETHGIPNVWFCARDGYLIQQLYHILTDEKDTSKYFITSRIAAIRAGVENDEDLNYVDSMKYSGKLEDNLKERFGICINEIEDIPNEFENGILKYRKAILGRAAKVRKGYKTYIKGLDVKEGTIALFDFVAKGTTQYFINRLVENHLKGLYFLQVEPDYMKSKNLDIIPFYSDEEINGSAIFDSYYIMETILTCASPSVLEFSDSGEPIYSDETRSDTDKECIGRAQKGIINFFKDYCSLCPLEDRIINKKLDEVFLSLIHNVEISDCEFLKLIVEDPFFNRMTNITDLL